MLRWILKEIWEKINLPQVYRGLKALGKKHGRRFFWAALIWEIIEDVVFPFISWLCGVPELIPVFLILHFEPIVYPIFFWGFKMWDRAHGRDVGPDRPVQSAYWRSIVKGLTFQLAIMGWLSHFVPWKSLIVFAILMSLFGFVHERIWHDVNYGIQSDDNVRIKRPAAKTVTYLLVSTITLYPLLRVAGASPIWRLLLIAQSITGFLYLVLETVWAKSRWGVIETHSRPANDEQP